MMSRTALNIVTFFSKTDEHFGNYEGLTLDDFSTNKKDYFLDCQTDSDGVHHIRLSHYIDLLEAPYHITNAQNDASFIYNRNLLDHYFNLFPTAKDYATALQCNISRIKEHLVELEVNQESKELILYAIIKSQKDLTSVLEKLGTIPESYKTDKYANTALYFIKEVQTVLSNFYNKVELTPAEIFFYNHYLNHPSKSWIENPLAFFISLLYGSGLQVLLSEFRAYAYVIPYKSSEEAQTLFINSRLWSKAHESIKFINKKIKSIKNKPKKEGQLSEKQVYLTEISSNLKQLHAAADKHWIAEHTSKPTLPYKIIVEGLSKYYTNFNIHPPFDATYIKYLPFIYDRMFLKRLLALKLPNSKGELVTICNKRSMSTICVYS